MSNSRYHRASYLLSAHTLAQCPDDNGREVAFAGRSNVGKSSVINTITGNHKLARTSRTPGRTQQLNFFSVGGDDRFRLVDLPGYGYAKVPEKIRRHWRSVLQAYFEQRHALAGLILIMDIRQPLKPFDEQMLAWCLDVRLPVHIVLNKADKISRGAAAKVLQMVKNRYPDEWITAQVFSAVERTGVDEVRKCLDAWLNGAA